MGARDNSSRAPKLFKRKINIVMPNESQVFKVALNPRNPEANSWYDAKVGVNLFLGPVKDTEGKVVSGPISKDLSMYDSSELRRVIQGINAGLLIVAEGNLPEGVNVSNISVFGASRSRWATKDEDGKDIEGVKESENAALSSWDKLVAEAEEKAKKQTANKTTTTAKA